MMCSMKSVAVSSLMILVLNIICGCSSQCGPDEYQFGSDCCSMCPAGKRVETHCTQNRNTSCTECVERTFMDQSNGLKHCFPCKDCDADVGVTVKMPCTTTADAVCEPLEGFYCVDLTNAGCATAKRHTSCQPGQYIRMKGTTQRDTVCSDCSDGTYSDGTFTSCQRHTQCQSINLLIKAGNVSADAECGPAGSDWTGLTVGLVVGLILIVAGAVAVICFIKKGKKGKIKITRTKGTNKVEQETENETQMLDNQ